MSKLNKEMLVSDILYNDTNIEQSEANQMATTIEQNFKALNSFRLLSLFWINVIIKSLLAGSPGSNLDERGVMLPLHQPPRDTALSCVNFS